MIIKAVEDISTNFYLLNALVVVGLIIYLLWRKPQSRLGASSRSLSKKGLKELARELEDMEKTPDREPPQEEIQLNVMFNWNGHSWDAYEVLGIPAGSNLNQVTKAYEEEMVKMDEESRAFIQKAYQAIMTQRNG